MLSAKRGRRANLTGPLFVGEKKTKIDFLGETLAEGWFRFSQENGKAAG